MINKVQQSTAVEQNYSGAKGKQGDCNFYQLSPLSEMHNAAVNCNPNRTPKIFIIGKLPPPPK